MHMVRARSDAGVYAAILVTNLIALYGVLLWGWQAREVLMLYGVEILVAGVFGALRIAAADTGAQGRGPHMGWVGKLFCVALSILLWGPFWYVYLLALAIFFPAQPAHEGSLRRLVEVGASDPVILAGLAALLCQHVWLFLRYMNAGGYRGASIGELIVDPLRRVIVTQAFVIIAIVVATVQGTTALLIVPFVLLRTGIELYLEGRDGLGNPGIPE